MCYIGYMVLRARGSRARCLKRGVSDSYQMLLGLRESDVRKSFEILDWSCEERENFS